MSRRTRIVQDWVPDPWDDPAELVEVASERPRKPKLVTRIVGTTILFAVMAFILVVGAVGWWTIRQVNPPGDPGAKVNFTVTDVDTIETVADRLQQQGVISNARVFKEYVKRKGGLELQPGYFTVRPKDNMGNIMAVLKTPPALTFQNVTFPEGFTVSDMGARLAKEVTRLNATRFDEIAYTGDGVTSRFKPEGVASMEGLLFPDTYQVAGNETEAQVIKRMADRMDRVASQLGIDKPPYEGWTPYMILTIASIIEREAKVEEDRAKISAVIWNRLSVSMPLEIDATLLYKQDPKTPFADLRNRDTPYNTYLHQGLPPTPISNPGAASIRAALHPAANPDPGQCAKGDPCRYLYYVLADPTGKHVFATNLADHDKNVATARAAGLLD